MRGLTKALTALALVGSVGALPTTAAAVARYSIETEAAILYGVEADNGYDVDGGRSDDGTVSGTQVPGSDPAQIMGQIDTEYTLGSLSVGQNEGNSSAGYDNTGSNFTVPQHAPLDPGGGLLNYSSNRHFGESSALPGDILGELLAGTSGSLAEVEISNPSGATDPLVVDLLISIVTDVTVSTTDSSREYAFASSSFTMLMNGEETPFQPELIRSVDSDGLDEGPSRLSFGYTMIVNPGESGIFQLMQSSTAQLTSSIVPTPATLPLMGAALIGLGVVARRRRAARR